MPGAAVGGEGLFEFLYLRPARRCTGAQHFAQCRLFFRPVHRAVAVLEFMRWLWGDPWMALSMTSPQLGTGVRQIVPNPVGQEENDSDRVRRAPAEAAVCGWTRSRGEAHPLRQPHARARSARWILERRYGRCRPRLRDPINSTMNSLSVSASIGLRYSKSGSETRSPARSFAANLFSMALVPEPSAKSDHQRQAEDQCRRQLSCNQLFATDLGSAVNA